MHAGSRSWCCCSRSPRFRFYYVSLDLPKTIVNQAILGEAQTVPDSQFLRLSVRPAYRTSCCCASLFSRRADQWRLQVLHQHAQGPARRAMLRRLRYQLYLRLLRFPLTSFPQGRRRPKIIPMVTAEVRVARRLYRRCLCAAGVPGRHAADDRLFHVHAGPGARARGDRALPVAGLRHPEAAAEGEPARQAARAHRAQSSPTASRNRPPAWSEIHTNDTVKLAR